MKNLFFSVLFIILFTLGSQIVYTVEPLILAVDGQWPPYNYNTDTKLSGVDILLSEKIFEEANIQLDVQIFPSKRAMLYLKSGEISVLCGASFTEERNKFANYSIPYRSERLGIMVRKDNVTKWPIEKLKDISNYPNLILSAGRGGWYGSQYQEILDDPEISRQLYFTDDISSRLQMLCLNRVDMVIGDINALVWNAAQLNMENSVELHPLTLSAEPIYFIFSKDSVSPEIIDSVNYAIDLLTENGTLDKIKNDFINTHMPSAEFN